MGVAEETWESRRGGGRNQSDVVWTMLMHPCSKIQANCSAQVSSTCISGHTSS